MKHTIRIDGIDVEVTTEQGAQTFARFQKTQDDAMKALQAKLDTATADATKLQAKIDTLQKDVETKDAAIKELPAKLKAEGKARAELEGDVRKVLGSKVKLDKLDDTACRLLALEKLDVKLPESKAKDEAYVTARFDSELERFDADEEEPATARARRNVEPVENADDDNADTDGDGDDEGEEEGDDESEPARHAGGRPTAERADAARAKMIKDRGQEWKKNAKRLGVNVD